MALNISIFIYIMIVSKQLKSWETEKTNREITVLNDIKN